jgi:hypothetical protein
VRLDVEAASGLQVLLVLAKGEGGPSSLFRYITGMP